MKENHWEKILIKVFHDYIDRRVLGTFSHIFLRVFISVVQGNTGRLWVMPGGLDFPGTAQQNKFPLMVGPGSYGHKRFLQLRHQQRQCGN